MVGLADTVTQAAGCWGMGQLHETAGGNAAGQGSRSTLVDHELTCGGKGP